MCTMCTTTIIITTTTTVYLFHIINTLLEITDKFLFSHLIVLVGRLREHTVRQKATKTITNKEGEREPKKKQREKFCRPQKNKTKQNHPPLKQICTNSQIHIQK